MNRKELIQEIVKHLKAAGYTRIKTGYSIPGPDRSAVIPICLLDDQDSPSLAIRIIKPRKRPETKSKRNELYRKLAGCQVITIHSRQEAANIDSIIQQLFKS